MINIILNKLSDLQKQHLDTLSKLSAKADKQNNEMVRTQYRGHIRGYLAALEDLQIITQANLKSLYVYYATVKNNGLIREQMQ